MTDYSAHLVSARIALQALEDAANDRNWTRMAAAAQAVEVHAEEMRQWACAKAPETRAPSIPQ